ncbi:MAG: MBL fold metallo-hydrolase [Pyrinomonadaceae bacterium]
MEVTVLGSGSAIPQARRSSSGYWVETSVGSIALDFSASSIKRMADEKLNWANLDVIWISHFHLDHLAGVAPFLFGTKYANETRLRKKPLRIFGPRGVEERIKLLSVGFEISTLPFSLEFTEVEPRKKFEILPGVEAATFSTPHTVESLAIRIMDANRKSLAYSADTGFTKELAVFALNADLFILECGFPENKPVETHLQADEAVWLARASKAKLTMLTHFFPEWDVADFGAMVEARSGKAKIIEAFDGLRIEV